MLALCADGALGRYVPYGRESVVPIRGGIDVIWRAFPSAVPNFRVKVIELIPTDGNTVVIQAEMSRYPIHDRRDPPQRAWDGVSTGVITDGHCAALAVQLALPILDYGEG